MNPPKDWKIILAEKEAQIAELQEEISIFAEKEKAQEGVFEQVYDLYKLLTKQKEELEVLNDEILQKNEEINQQSEEMNAQNETLLLTMTELIAKEKHISDSIRYAKKIQTAMLPFPERIDKSLQKENYFIFYKPRDVVSGDFYFCEQIGKKTVIVAADCTGHGVPGALMSMIGMNILEEAIFSKQITSPNLILNDLHEKIRYALKQEETLNRDGMDVAICVIDTENKILEYAGAKNSIYIIQNEELREIKADKTPIGGHQNEEKRQFSKHKLDISEPTHFYMFSDGYQDQFGGAKDKKFMKKRFRELLYSNHKKSLSQQKEILDTTLAEWQDNTYNQTDDILVIGIKTEL